MRRPLRKAVLGNGLAAGGSVTSRDVKEIVGVLMRVAAGGEIAPDEVTALGFEADGALEAALNEAYIKLLEFAHDRDVRASDGARDAASRAELDGILRRLAALTGE